MQKKSSAKKLIPQNSEKGKKLIESAKKKESLIKINLDSASAKRIASYSIKERNPIISRESILYNYPNGWDKNQISGIEGKNFRGKLRRNLLHFIDMGILYFQKKRNEDLKNLMKEFFEFYKKNYRINDFSIASISQKKDLQERFRIEDFLSIAKNFNPFKSPASKKSASKGKSPASKKNARKGIKSPKLEGNLPASNLPLESSSINPASE